MKTMRVWAVANQKGGVGKTTTSIALAGLLADAGKRVVVVDLDPHGSMTSYFGHDPDTLEHSCFDLFQHSGGVPSDLPKQLLLQTSHERISLLPSSTALATLERQSPGKSGLGLVIAKSLAQLWQDYDHAVIDSPPLLGVLMVNALAASQQLVIPVQTEFLAVKGLERMINTLAMINRSRQQALPYTIVPTLFDRRTQASMGTLRVLRNTYPEHLWPAYIPVDTRLRDASRAGLVPSNFDSNSRGVIAYRALLKHLLSQQIAAQVA
jgi:chromosome partitioning protein